MIPKHTVFVIAFVLFFSVFPASIPADEPLMSHLPLTKEKAVVRTDFSNPEEWKAVCDAIQRPSDEGFRAHVDFVDDKAFNGASLHQILSALPPKYPHSFVFIVDEKTIATKDHPILVVKLGKTPGKTFRALPSTIQVIENNLSIGNRSFSEFADSLDESGVYRGPK